MSRGKTRFAVLTWDAEGDMGDAVATGAFHTVGGAEIEAARLRESDGGRMQAMVVLLKPGGTARQTVYSLALGKGRR